MKFRTDKNILKFFTASVSMALLGAILSMYVNPPFLGGGLILGGVILTVMGIYVASKPKEYFIQDERSKRITDMAGHHAFWLTVDVVVILSVLDRFKFIDFDFRDAGTLILFVGIYSFMILKWYYNKKGE